MPNQRISHPQAKPPTFSASLSRTSPLHSGPVPSPALPHRAHPILHSTYIYTTCANPITFTSTPPDLAFQNLALAPLPLAKSLFHSESAARISPPATTASSALSAAAAGARVASSATAASAASFRLSLRDGAATSTLCSACASASLTSSTLSASSTRLLHRGEFFTGRRLAMASAAVVPTGGAHEEAGLGKGEETTHAVPVQATAIHDTHKIHVASPDDAAHRPAVPVRSHDMLAPFTAAHQFTDAHPLVIVKSEGVYIWDSDGRRYLDGLAGLWSTALGGNEQRLIDAADAQMKKLPFYHSFWNRATEPAMELAKELTGMFTAERMGQVFFTNSGSDANDTQVKLVWYYNNALGRPNKKKFIARDKAYHGSTLVSASLTGLSPLHKRWVGSEGGGVLGRGRGLRGGARADGAHHRGDSIVIAMSPALIVSPGETQELLSVIRLALKETEAYVQSKIDMD
ncbi:unnamed protein product [Closterium sp. NIES-54]